MPIIGSLLVLLIVFATIFSSNQAHQKQTLQEAEIEAVAGNFMIYRNIVSAYAESNPAMTGAVTDLSLGLPTWYQRQPGMGNYLVGGKSYVFLTTALPGLVGTLAERSQSMGVGINSGGWLKSPIAGNTGIPLPAQVPQSAVVIVQ